MSARSLSESNFEKTTKLKKEMISTANSTSICDNEAGCSQTQKRSVIGLTSFSSLNFRVKEFPLLKESESISFHLQAPYQL